MEQKIYVEKIRNNYTEKQVTKFDELKELNKKVNRPAQVGAYLFGSASALVLGTGMCFAMKVLGATLALGMPIGIGVGCVGLAMVGAAYPLYKKLLQYRRQRYASEVMQLSAELLNE